LRLVCDRLTFPPAQRALFTEDEKSHRVHSNLVAALDTIRSRFGDNAIRMGRTLAA
jgi:DNA polymerase-4